MVPLEGDDRPAVVFEGEEDNDAAAEGVELKEDEVASVAWLGCDVEGVPEADLRERLCAESKLSCVDAVSLRWSLNGC